MRLEIVNCPCSNPDPHWKWRTADGRETPSFFSLAQGNAQLKDIERSGEFTADEIADARTKLASCDLPAEPGHTEDELVSMAASLVVALPVQDRETFVLRQMKRGVVSTKSADRIRELLKDETATLKVADVEDLLKVFAIIPVEKRGAKMRDLVEANLVDREHLEQLREKLKDAPFAHDSQSATEAVKAADRMAERIMYRSGFGSGRVEVMVLEVMVGGGSASMN
ncbi:MAG: hypothetical protein AAB617_01740 [Patescibacteria group bacterium]|mgnify:CR=1 FL=1